MEDLPRDILHLIGARLNVFELRAMRETCKTFASNICKASEQCVSVVHSNEHVAQTKLVTKLCLKPHLRKLVTVFNKRTDQATIDAHFNLLSTHPTTLHRLDHLVLQPLSNTPVVRLHLVSGLVGLQKLSLVGSRAAFDVEQLSLFTRLTYLSIKWEDADTCPSKYSRLMACVGALTNLERLVLPTHLTLSYVHHLSALTRLTRLRFIGESGGLVIPDDYLALAHLTCLRSLDVHVPTCVCLKPLRNLHLLTGDEIDGGLRVRTTTPLCLKMYLMYMTTHLRRSITEVSMCRVQRIDEQDMRLLAGLTRLRHLELSKSFYAATHTCDDLSCLSSLTQLQLFSYTFSHVRSVGDTSSALATLFDRWSTTLVHLTLHNVIANDLVALPHLRRLSNLALRADDQGSSIRLDMSRLPSSLYSLSLAGFEVTAPEFSTNGERHRLEACRALVLHGCTTRDTHNFRETLRALPLLSSLQITELHDLREGHLMEMGSLRHLTSLGVMAIGNGAVNNSMMCHLTPLVNLRLLQWHVGDAMDMMIDPHYIKNFRNLLVMCITNREYQRMVRWGSIEAIDHLVQCQLRVYA